MKQARNESQIFNMKMISRNTTHRRSDHLIQLEKIMGTKTILDKAIKIKKQRFCNENEKFGCAAYTLDDENSRFSAKYLFLAAVLHGF